MYRSVIALMVALFSQSFISNAQPFLLKSVGQSKPFSLKIYYGTQGKGAFVQYVGQKGIIPLRARHVEIDRSEDSIHYTTVFVWEEIWNGKVTGSYGLREALRSINEPWYLRSKDQKRFKLQSIESKEDYDGVDKYYLHNTLIEFNHFYNDKLVFRYPGNRVMTLSLPEIVQPGGARQSHIADYNFDGFDDVSFSVADAGMGVYQEYNIYLYNPVTQRFYRMPEPDFGKASCSCLCDVKLDTSKKLLFTSCRGGAKWWQNVWQYKNGKLVWLRSEENSPANN